jgi:transcriptional regulator with XRE-family HTH domain
VGYENPMQKETSEIKKMLGNRIRSLRVSRSLTQQALGELSSMNYKYLGGIERGERNPTLENLIRIAGGLEIELHELFILEHETPDRAKLKEKLDEMLQSVDDSEFRKAFRIVFAFVD